MNGQNKSKEMKYFTSLIAITLFFVACTKSPGIGGKATVKGHVNAIYVQEGSFDTIEVSAFPDTRIYIVYGDGNTQDDDTRTSPDGSYKFEFLNPGDYTLYTYSESLLVPSELEVVSTKITVDKKQNDIVVPTFTVIKYVK